MSIGLEVEYPWQSVQFSFFSHTCMCTPQTQDEREKSILDKDKEAQALLEMASKPMHSAGLREPTEESVGEDPRQTGEGQT